MSESEEKQIVDEPEEEANLFVVDPDDYQRTKKIKAITEARKYVRELKQNRMQAVGKYEEFSGGFNENYNSHLGESIAYYGTELMPLFEKALEDGQIEESDLKVDLNSNKTIDVRTFIIQEGYEFNDEIGEANPRKTPVLMAVLRQLDRVKREIGLGLEFDQDQGPAQLEEEL